MEDSSKPSNDNLIEVPISGLLPGMFVAELDRPWLETPFALQGFVIRDERDAEYVGKHCEYVYVDPHKKVVGKYPLKAQPKRAIEVDEVPLKTEFEHSKVDFASASKVMASVFAQVKSHRPVDLAVLQSAINPLIDSVFRNREALAALIRMKRKDDYFYNHSLATAVWAAILGRHLGLEKPVLRQLALGASIMDVGMAELPDELLNETDQLNAPQIAQIRGHVATSLKIVQEHGEVSNTVLNIIACHHERYDGSGYPQGLSGNTIPKLARIAGLADAYDAMITDRPYSAARSSFDAIQELADTKGVLFQGSMVEHFVQAVGMFPTGAVVELNTGEVGVVVEQNSTRRLRPKVVLILDETKKKRNTLTVLDLSKYAGADSATSTMWIAKELKIGAFGIAPDDYFL
jgi:HD-GYP domain-containing protein (c-di-GMP phosphodiesterase class II)